MWWNKLTTRPEHILAVKLTASIVGVLVGVVILVLLFGVIRQWFRQDRFFEDHVRMLEASPRFRDVFLSWGDLPWEMIRGRWVPPAFRNLIIQWPSWVRIVWFLSDAKFVLPDDLPMGHAEFRRVADENILFYGTRLWDSTVFFYENADIIKDMRYMVFVLALVLICLFWAVFYFIALWMARKTIDPIVKSEERARSYNRHIAHELKTPLAVMSSDLDLALRDVDRMEHLSSALDEISSMRQTIDNLLFLAAREAKPSFVQLFPLALCRSLESEVSKNFPDSSLKFIYEWNQDIQLMADEGWLRVLFRNLFENAYKYAQPDSVVTIKFTTQSISFCNIVSEALSEENIRSIFDPFSGTPGTGHGLGLSIVKRIVDMHAWNISAHCADKAFEILIRFSS